MNTSDQKNGGQNQNALFLERKNFSLTDRFFGDQWLLEFGGAISDVAADDLLGYAYMQKGVKQVSLEIDPDQDNNGARPVLTYKVNLKFWRSFSFKFARYFFGRSNLATRFFALILVRIGFPAPNYYQLMLGSYATKYLPGNYTVRVEII